MRTGKRYFLLLSLVLLFGVRLEGAQPAPEFSQVYDLLKSNLTAVSVVELNQAAVEGLLSRLSPRAALESATAGESTNAPLARFETFDGDLVCFRVARVSTDLGAALSEAYAKVSATNKARGVVLDLRYATGRDFPAAVTVVNQFVRKDQPLLDWGEGMVTAKPAPQPISVPVAVLVNSETRGAPEALAAAMRSAGVALIFGSRTAGEAAISRTFPLSNGDRLRVATAPIRLGDGTTLPLEGVTPDIAVQVAAAQEKLFYSAPYLELTNTATVAGTNSPARRTRYGEAELVRERKAGTGPDSVSADSPADQPVVQDPALARALDVLKGLAVVRRLRP